jgi:glycosyltransferase involved in cell wall biosynthesis
MAQSILYLVSEDWFFVSHRLPMARAAKAAGYDVHVAARVGACADAITREGFTLHPVTWRRGSLNPLRLTAAILETRRLYRRVRPDLAHHVAVLPVAIGSLAAIGLPLQVLNAFTGLGFTFAANTLRARLLRGLAGVFLGWLLNRPQSTVLVQNPDDRAVIAKLGVPPDRIAMIAGSGVDIDAFAPLADPINSMVTAALVSRLVDGKGVRTLVRAHEILFQRGGAIRLLLAGAPDPLNPTSIADDVLATWRKIPNLVMLGHVDDVREVWRQAHIAVLPSRGGEGIPMSLLEAAACGRPLIATDVSGCREVARPGKTGLLVPPDNPEALANALATLANDPVMRLHFGQNARQLVSEQFSSARIQREIVALYARLLDPLTRLRSARS